MNWETVRLADYCQKIGSGATPKGGESVYVDSGVSLIRSQNVYNLQFDYSGLTHITKEAASKLDSVTVNYEDILLNITGDSVARTCMVPNDVLPARVNQHVCIIRTNPKDFNPKFLNYYLASPYMQDHMLNLAVGKGASRNALTKGLIEDFMIPKPQIDVQKKIVAILSAYDNLIEVNNKRIKVLEQMAENLYKEWFVRFRFPGYESVEFENGNLGKQPTSFSIIKMQDAFEYYIGGGWGNDNEDKDYPVEAYVIRGTDFPHVSKGDVSSCPLRYHKESNYDARELKPDDIILEVSGGTAEQPVGRTLLVTDDVLERLGRKAICASFCKQIRVKKDIVSPIYFFYWMQFLYETRIIDSFQLQSTGIINFQFEYFLRKGEIMLPTKEIMNSFDALIRPIHKEIASIAKTNANLIRQRDMLLPRLMTGKLEV